MDRDRTQLGLNAIMQPVTSYLLGSGGRPLTELYDVALLDLDGVVYVGSDAVPGVPDALRAARAAGMRLGFVTNNAARPPAAVARHLTQLGIGAEPAEVVTSSQAAAHYLSDRLSAGAEVLVVGTTGLWHALRERGLTPVAEMRDGVAAVVQGYSPDLNWKQLAEGAVAIRSGVPWVATNLDATVPSPRGPLPGNGSMVAALRHATGATPKATGKPDPTMHSEMVARTAAERPLIVGDRLDTDIAGAVAVGCPSVLVLTGVTSAAGALAAAPGERPSYLAVDVRGILRAHPEPEIAGAEAACGGWRAARTAGGLTLARRSGSDIGAARADADPDSAVSEDDVDAWRALCAAWWDGGVSGAVPTVRPADESGRAALGRLGLLGT